jgi:MoaA/NifB/PqqE/SkfB family radical SAM enzyme
MKFPLRLSMDLLRGKVTCALSGSSSSSIIHHLSPSVFSSSNQSEIAAESDPTAALMEIPANIVAQTSAPILWVGGDEPLQHPVIGRVAAALNGAGRNVFLHTNGARLRQRIHEFRPDPRLFLTLELAGREEIHDRVVGQPGAFRRVVEGIRAAKLSGFHVCTHITANERTEVCETGELFESMDRYDVDGFMVSSGGAAIDRAKGTAINDRLEEIRALIRCSRWENFSELLEASYVSPRETGIAVLAPSSVPPTDAGAVEESA